MSKKTRKKSSKPAPKSRKTPARKPAAAKTARKTAGRGDKTPAKKPAAKAASKPAKSAAKAAVSKPDKAAKTAPTKASHKPLPKPLKSNLSAPPKLTEEQKQRYSRHLLIPEVGAEGQAKLLGSTVLFIGAGGLGSPALLYLAAAGVGTIGIVDFDVVDLSNLQRQIVHTNDRIGEKKVDSARRTLNALNPDVKVVAHEEMLVADNVERIIAGYDAILDGTDTFETRYILNDAAVAAGIPVIHASVFRFEGQLTTFIPYEGPCYRCLYPTPPPPELAPGCSVAGVLGVVPGIMGLLQANEVLKVLLGIGETLAGRLLLFDALETEFTELKLRRDPKCPVCSDEAKAAREAGTPLPVSTFTDGVFTLNAPAEATPLVATPLGGPR